MNSSKTGLPVLVLLFIFAVPAVASPPYTISLQMTAATQPVGADGSVDYLLIYNERMSAGVTPENNGFVGMLGVVGTSAIPGSVRDQILIMAGADDLPVDTGWVEYSGREMTGWPHVWVAGENPERAKYIGDHKKLIDLAVEAAGRARWWCPGVTAQGNSMLSVLLPDLNPISELTGVLVDRATLRVGAGDIDGFISDIVAAKRMARHACGLVIVNDLVADGRNGWVDRAVGAALASGKFSAEQCSRLQRGLREAPPLQPSWMAMDTGERWMALDMVSFVARGKDDPTVREFAPQNVWREKVDWDVVLKHVNAEMDDAVRVMKMESYDDSVGASRERLGEFHGLDQKKGPPNARIQPGETREAYTARVAGVFLASQGPPLRAAVTDRDSRLMDSLVTALLGAAKYRADHGSWPAKLEDLVPGYLGGRIVDPYSPGGEDWVKYRLTENGPVVSSVGRLFAAEGSKPLRRAADMQIGAWPH